MPITLFHCYNAFKFKKTHFETNFFCHYYCYQCYCNCHHVIWWKIHAYYSISIVIMLLNIFHYNYAFKEKTRFEKKYFWHCCCCQCHYHHHTNVIWWIINAYYIIPTVIMCLNPNAFFILYAHLDAIRITFHEKDLYLHLRSNLLSRLFSEKPHKT